MKKISVFPFLVFATTCALSFMTQGLSADSFGTGTNQFTIDFTSVGDAVNAADPRTGYGSVEYDYRIGVYSASVNQIRSALNQGLSNVSVGPYSGNQPAIMAWYEAAAFVNWLNTSRGHAPAYNLAFINGVWTMNVWSADESWQLGGQNLFRNKGAHYFLPTANESYKAAYFDPATAYYYLYPTGSDSPPTSVASGTNAGTAVYERGFEPGVGPVDVKQAGGLSPYGTMGQGGNVTSFTESTIDVSTNPAANRIYGAGNWFNGVDTLESTYIFTPYANNGLPIESSATFRVASVSNPPTNDSDNDGVSDSQETAADTDPKDAADYPVYTKISLADVANTRLDALLIPYDGFTYEENLMLGSFPFDIPSTRANVWHSYVSGGNSAVTSITLPINVSNIHGFATLINTYWGRTESPHPTIHFTFSDGSSYTKSLVGGEDIRDYNILGIHTTSINGTSSVQSWASGSGNPVLDRQYFNLSAAGHGGKTLASVTLTDYGPSDVISLSAAQRAFLVGATAVSRAGVADADNDGIPDAYETNTGVYVSPADTGTDPNNPDSDGDGLSDGVETASYIYTDATDTGTDPNIPDTDGDGLFDSVETNTGVYVSATNTGTNPLNDDTSNDGITDGEAVTAQFNPLIDQRPVLNFLTQAVASQPNRFGFYNEANVMHLGMGGLMIRKSGSAVNIDLQWQTKTSLTDAWTNHGAPLPFFLNLPGSKAFIRLQATPGAP